MPPVDPAQYESMPFMERMRMLATHWAEYGFGSPKQNHMLYVYKLLAYVLGGVTIVGLTTPGLGGLGDLGAWWDEPILYQKLMVWTILLEILGLRRDVRPAGVPLRSRSSAESSTGGRTTPSGCPRTRTTSRSPRATAARRGTPALYKLIVADLAFMLLVPGEQVDGLPGSEAGVLPQWALVTYCCLIILMGLRDKIVFLSARSEQYVADDVLLRPVQQLRRHDRRRQDLHRRDLDGRRLLEAGHHFSNVVPIMVQNTPWMVSQRFQARRSTRLPERHPALEGQPGPSRTSAARPASW